MDTITAAESALWLLLSLMLPHPTTLLLPRSLALHHIPAHAQQRPVHLSCNPMLA